MAQAKESMRQVADAAVIADRQKRSENTPAPERRFKPEPPGFYRGVRIKKK
jgi:hypothetical protein